jgi:CBS domain-containing protein
MSTCTYCGHLNTDGVDECVECQAPLSDLHLADPGPVEQGLLSDRIAALVTRPPRVVPPGTPVGDVLALLTAESVGCVLVMDGGRIVGIFSERDALLRLNARAEELAGHPVAEFMTPNPECLDGSAKIAFALQRMDLGGYRHVPVVDADGRATGVISIRDVLRYLTDRMTRAAGAEPAGP